MKDKTELFFTPTLLDKGNQIITIISNMKYFASNYVHQYGSTATNNIKISKKLGFLDFRACRKRKASPRVASVILNEYEPLT